MRKPLLKQGYSWDDVTQEPVPTLTLREVRRLRRLEQKQHQRIAGLLFDLAQAVHGLEHHRFIMDIDDFDNMRSVSDWLRQYEPPQAPEPWFDLFEGVVRSGEAEGANHGAEKEKRK